MSPIRTLLFVPSVLVMTRWRRNPAAVLAALWAVAFCLTHLYWAFGGTRLLPTGLRLSGHSTIYLIDLFAIPACLIAAGSAWRISRGPYRRWIFLLGSAGAVIMLWHAGLNYLFLGVRSALGQPMTTNDRYYAFLFEPFWLVGGVLWLLAVLRFHRLEAGSRVVLDLGQHPGLDRFRRVRHLDRIPGQRRDARLVEVE